MAHRQSEQPDHHVRDAAGELVLRHCRPSVLRAEIDVGCEAVGSGRAVADFTGVPLTALMGVVQPNADARFIDFMSFDDDYHESWDIESAMHPQTMVVLAKDGKRLSAQYGAPARIHGPIKLGYKNTKFLTKIVVMPAANGGYWSDRGYEWYGGT